tara:strand:- start:12 stop:497 length:486 start_codon:yes stop_codon:yes gene_type:complete
MAWITTEQVKEIRVALKNKFPEIKFSVRKEHGTSVHVNILKSPYDFSYLNRFRPDGYTSISRYHIPEGPHKNLFEEILEIILFGSSRKFYDNSDAQIDYFDCAFYVNMGIGDWGKGYEMIPWEKAKKMVAKKVKKKTSKKKTKGISKSKANQLASDFMSSI